MTPHITSPRPLAGVPAGRPSGPLSTRLRSVILAAAVLLLAAACSPSLTTLTSSVRERNAWTEDELSRIQFYLSDDIVLTRERKSGSTAIVQGQVRVKDGRRIEELVFERGTPGVVLSQTAEGQLAIGFDERRDDRFLKFGPNPNRGGEYMLLGKANGRYSTQVMYDGKVWDVSNLSANVRLLFNMKRSGSVNRESSSVGGRRL